MNNAELKQAFYNALGRYDSAVADTHWSDFVALHAADESITVARYAAFVTELMGYSEGLMNW